MIGQLRGIILEKQPPALLLDVQGVGYEIDAPMSTFYHLPESGQEVVLFTHFVVREDAHHLYGFYTREERQLFRTLIKVNGVGPRLGLTIFTVIILMIFLRRPEDLRGFKLSCHRKTLLLQKIRDFLRSFFPSASGLKIRILAVWSIMPIT